MVGKIFPWQPAVAASCRAYPTIEIGIRFREMSVEFIFDGTTWSMWPLSMTPVLVSDQNEVTRRAFV